MDKILKFLKIILLIIAIAVGLLILGGAFFVYKGLRSGDLLNYLAKTTVENTSIGDKLTEEQKEMLDSGDYEALAEDIGENITEEQIDELVEILKISIRSVMEKV